MSSLLSGQISAKLKKNYEASLDTFWSPYLKDIAPCNFFLFLKVKTYLEVKVWGRGGQEKKIADASSHIYQKRNFKGTLTNVKDAGIKVLDAMGNI